MAKLNEDDEWQIGAYGPSNCPPVLEIRDGRTNREEPLCGGSSSAYRERQIYVSSAQSISVSFSVHRPGFNIDTLPHFIVEYQGMRRLGRLMCIISVNSLYV